MAAQSCAQNENLWRRTGGREGVGHHVVTQFQLQKNSFYLAIMQVCTCIMSVANVATQNLNSFSYLCLFNDLLSNKGNSNNVGKGGEPEEPHFSSYGYLQ